MGQTTSTRRDFFCQVAAGTRATYPGWYRAVEYMPRAQEICRRVYPRLLAAVRRAGVTLLHVVGGGAYYQSLPGYRRAVKLGEPLSCTSNPGESRTW